MDFDTFQLLRSACRVDVASYIDGPNANAALRLNAVLHGDLAKLKWEADQAASLYTCDDLTLRERVAAHMLAVISNHRAIAWHREPKPNGREPAPPLSDEQTAALWAQTRKAVEAYAVHLPEREAEWLRAQVLQHMPQASEPAVPTARPQQAGEAQDAAILDALRQAGYAPQALPRNPPGKSGPKARIRTMLKGKSNLFPKDGTQFEHAWDRLRASKKIVDA